MLLVSHDSIWIRKYGAIHGHGSETIEENTGDVQKGQHVDTVADKDDTGDKDNKKHKHAANIVSKNITDKELKKITNHKNVDKAIKTDEDDIELKIKINRKTLAIRRNNTGDKESKKIIFHKNFKKNDTNWRSVEITPDTRRTVKNKLKKRDLNKTRAKRVFEKKDLIQKVFKNNNHMQTAIERFNKKKIRQTQYTGTSLRINSVGNVLKRTKQTFYRKPKWSTNSGVLIFLMMLNVVGLSSAIDASSFSSALTSRMIASFLGYPSTCSLGTEVRPCTLSFTCWLRGGTRLRGCGGWLFSCCGPPEPNREGYDNSIASSDWKYKMSPPKLRQVPQRSVMPNNVFRRRVDDHVSQMDCGLSSSRILQKRIIGGREARFAEFPWQAHVRISEFQCGGVLVSRRYVATAAHCVSRAHTRDIVVWLGAIDTSATHHPARKLGVVQKILHPLFQFRMTQPDRYDIALLKLSRPITYTSHILPICLPDYDMELRGRSGVIAGWGKTDASNGHTGTNLLRSANVPILSKEQCINWHQSKQISVEIHSEMICAGHSDGHQDACLGDSGGPLIVLDNGRYYLVGITSAGFGCGVDHQPGIYHNVKLTANWIRGVISPSVNYNDV